MKYALLTILLGLLYATQAAQPPCYAHITANVRANSGWTDGFTSYQVYDITAINEGSCPLLRVVGFFSAGAGRITEAWNYDYTTGLITGYGSALQVGQIYHGAGFVIANSSTTSLAFDRPGCDDACIATHTPTTAPTSTPTPTTAPTTSSCGGSQCASNQVCLSSTEGPTCFYRLCSDLVCAGANQVCINNGGYARCITTSPTTATPTSSPTTPAPTTSSCGGSQCTSNQVCLSSTEGSACFYRSCSDLLCSGANQVCINDGGFARCITTSPTTLAPTSAPTTAAPTTQPAGTCAITASVVRDANSWTDAQGRNNTIHRLFVTNNGPCALSLYVTSFSFYPAIVVSTWNLQSTLGGYQVQGFGALAAGATYSGAGFILTNAPDRVTANTYGTSCKC